MKVLFDQTVFADKKCYVFVLSVVIISGLFWFTLGVDNVSAGVFTGSIEVNGSPVGAGNDYVCQQGSCGSINVTGDFRIRHENRVCPVSSFRNAGRETNELRTLRYDHSWGGTQDVTGDAWRTQIATTYSNYCDGDPWLAEEWSFDTWVDLSSLTAGSYTIQFQNNENEWGGGTSIWFGGSAAFIDILVTSLPTVTCNAYANPNNGNAPLSSDVGCNVGGTATGAIRYRIDCTDNGGWEHDFTTNSNPADRVCNYNSPGNYTAKVRVDRGGVWDEDWVLISVTNPNQPDLITINLAQGGLLETGQVLNFSGRVRNNDAGNATNSTARFCIDNNNCENNTSGRLGGDQGVPALGAWSNSALYSRNWTATLGAHTIYFCADVWDNESNESDENNNCSQLGFNVVAPPLPDLVPQSLSSSPGPAYANNSMSFSATIRNQGGAAAGNSATRLRIDIDNNATWDIVPGNNPTGALGINATEVENWNNAWPLATVGTHRFEICADIGAQVVEGATGEGNNCSTQIFTVSPALPALIAQNINAPGGLTAGSGTTLTADVTNIGIAAAGASSTRFCIDINNDQPASDCEPPPGSGNAPAAGMTFVAGVATGPLGVGATINETTPWVASQGIHAVVVCVDVGNAIAESDEAGCYKGAAFIVAALPNGGVIGRMILDTNGNGVWDAGENPIGHDVPAPPGPCAGYVAQGGITVRWDDGLGNSGSGNTNLDCWGGIHPVYGSGFPFTLPPGTYTISLKPADLPVGWQTTGYLVEGAGPGGGDQVNVAVPSGAWIVVNWFVRPTPLSDLTADNHDARPDGHPSGTAIISGDPITFSVDVINQEAVDTGAPFWVGMCIDTNQPIDGFCDVTPAFPFLGAFPPGFTQNVVWNDVDVGVLPPGTYIYHVYVDPFNNVAESDENNQTDIVGDFTWHSFEVVDTGGFSNRFYLDVDRDGVRDVPWGTGEPAVRDSSLAQCDPSESVIDLVQMSAVHNVTGETSGVYVTNNCNIPNPGDPLVPRILSSTNLRPGDWTFTASIPAPYSLNQANNLTFTVPAGLRVNLGSWGLTPPDFPPVASALTMVSPADFCAKVPAYTYSWNYSDIDGDPQTDYIFQIATDAGFVPGSIVVNRTNPPPNSESVLVTTPNNPDQLNYNTTYWWRVMVRNAANNSGWVNGPSSFLTPPNEYPTPSFTYLPVAPAASESVDFTDTSTCFDAGGTCGSWAWTFQNGTPPNSNSQNPTSFFTQGNNNITMTVWDGLGQTGFSCTIGPNILAVSAPIPDFIEVQPIGLIQSVFKWIAWMGF